MKCRFVVTSPISYLLGYWYIISYVFNIRFSCV